jgi:hypothetical protein
VRPLVAAFRVVRAVMGFVLFLFPRSGRSTPEPIEDRTKAPAPVEMASD